MLPAVAAARILGNGRRRLLISSGAAAGVCARGAIGEGEERGLRASDLALFFLPRRQSLETLVPPTAGWRHMSSPGVRVEKDTMGELEVPADK